MITIQNKTHSATINPLGAELTSFKNRQTQEEYIWQADPTYWGKSAPVLFPITGLLKNKNLTIQGKTYPMPKHGFAREQTFTTLNQQKERVLFELKANKKTDAVYPYDFSLQIEFKLSNQQLEVNYTIINLDKKELLFSIGSHPAFALDLINHRLSDYYIEFSQPETLDLFGLTNNLFTKKQSRFLDHAQTIPLNKQTFDDDALMFKNIQSKYITIKRKNSDWFLQLDRRNVPHLGIWAKPNAPFVCIEPWMSYNDAADSDGTLENKPGIERLPAGTSFLSGYTITVK